MAEKYAEERLYSPALGEAIAWALEKHARQLRKGTDIPYASHLLAVTALVMEAGGTETEAIAAVLHDVVEDIDEVSLADIRKIFGDAVAEIVAACIDAEVIPKPPWKERKLAYIAGLQEKSESALLVSLADKYHNANAILADYRELGEDLWPRFNGGKDGTLWYYEELARIIRARATGRLTHLSETFQRTVDTLITESAN